MSLYHLMFEKYPEEFLAIAGIHQSARITELFMDRHLWFACAIAIGIGVTSGLWFVWKKRQRNKER